MLDPIHLFVPTFRTEEVLAEIRPCFDKGWTGAGDRTVEFEAAWSHYTGLPHSHFLNSATAGLHLSFELLKEEGRWSDGDEVISTPFTFVSTNHTILHAGLRPVFADVDEYLCLDPESVALRITGRTRAVCFVGIGGNIGRLPAIAELCRSRGLKLVLDASHMAGTWTGEKHAGHEADVTVFSFQAVKNLPTADSGMVCFQSSVLDSEVRKWSWMGISKDTYSRTVGAGHYKWKYDVEHAGFKYHGNSVVAAIGLVGLKYLDQDNAYRRQLAAWYDEGLSSNPRVTTIPQPGGFLSSRHLYQVLVENRDEVILKLNQKSIYPGVHYADNTTYSMYSDAYGTCPRSLDASLKVISLPLHLRLTHDHVGRVVEALGSSTL